MKNVSDILKEKAELFERKNKEYGNTYIEFGEVMKTYFPDGLQVYSKKYWNKMGIFFMMVHKMMRIANTLSDNKNSLDSVKDIQVYAAMLEQLMEDEK